VAERIDEILDSDERVTLKGIIRGERPVDSLPLEKREETARHFRDLAAELSENQSVQDWERAAAYNVARAEYLLERIDVAPGDVAPSPHAERDGATFVELLAAGADFGPWVDLALEGLYTQEDADAAEPEDEARQDDEYGPDDDGGDDDELDDDGDDEPDDDEPEDEADGWDGDDDEREREEEEERELEEQAELEREEEEERELEEQAELEREEEEERDQDSWGYDSGQDEGW
jgi:hypothetical protein